MPKNKKKSPAKNNNAKSSPKIDSKLKDTSIAELNTVLKGEFMAIDSYGKFIDKVNNQQIKTELQNIQSSHKKQAMNLSNRIKALGGNPAKGLGITGKTLEKLSGIKDIGRNNENHFLQKAYNGEKSGIKMVSEIVKGDLDKDSNSLINSMISEDNTHLEALKSLLYSEKS
jgi:bacterioferritin (cytochrome b1)